MVNIDKRRVGLSSNPVEVSDHIFLECNTLVSEISLDKTSFIDFVLYHSDWTTSVYLSGVNYWVCHADGNKVLFDQVVNLPR